MRIAHVHVLSVHTCRRDNRTRGARRHTHNDAVASSSSLMDREESDQDQVALLKTQAYGDAAAHLVARYLR